MRHVSGPSSPALSGQEAEVSDHSQTEPTRSIRMRFRGTLMSTLVISTLALSAVPALAADERADGSDTVAKAMERDLGLTPEQAKAQDELQERAYKLDARAAEVARRRLRRLAVRPQERQADRDGVRQGRGSRRPARPAPTRASRPTRCVSSTRSRPTSTAATRTARRPRRSVPFTALLHRHAQQLRPHHGHARRPRRPRSCRPSTATRSPSSSPRPRPSRPPTGWTAATRSTAAPARPASTCATRRPARATC